MLSSADVSASKAKVPTAVFLLPVVNEYKASLPTAVLYDAVVARYNALSPTAVLLDPVVFVYKEACPNAVLLDPVVVNAAAYATCETYTPWSTLEQPGGPCTCPPECCLGGGDSGGGGNVGVCGLRSVCWYALVCACVCLDVSVNDYEK